MPMLRELPALIHRSAIALALPGCKIVKTPTADEAAEDASGGFNPARQVADIWDDKVIPYLHAKAGTFAGGFKRWPTADLDAAAGRNMATRKSRQCALDLCRQGRQARSSRPRPSRAPPIVEIDVDGDGKARCAHPDRPGHARHGDPRQPRLRQFQRVQEPDRLGRSSARRSTPMSSG